MWSFRIAAHWKNEWHGLMYKGEGEGNSTIGKGEGHCLSWLFLMNSQKKKKKNQPNNKKQKAQSASAFSPCAVAPQSTGLWLFGLAIHELPPLSGCPLWGTAVVGQRVRVRFDNASQGSMSCLPPKDCFILH